MNSLQEHDTRLDLALEAELQRLHDSVARRIAAESAYVEQYSAGNDPQHDALAQRLAEMQDQHGTEETALTEHFAAQRHEAEAEFTAARSHVQSAHDAAVAEAERLARTETERVTRQHSESRWVATSVLDESAEESPRRQFERLRASRTRAEEQQQAECAALEDAIREIADARGWSISPLAPPAVDNADLDSLSAEFARATTAARERLAEFRALWLPRLFSGWRPLWLLTALAVAIAAVVFFVVPPSAVGVTVSPADPTWVAISLGAAAAISALVLTILYTISSMRLSDVFSHLHEHTSDARSFHERWAELVTQENERREREAAALQAKHERQLQQQLERYEAAHQQTLAEIEQRRQSTIEAQAAERIRRIDELQAHRAERLAAIEESLQQQLHELTSRYRAIEDQARSELDTYDAQRERQRSEAWAHLQQEWFDAVQAFQTFADETTRDNKQANRPWTELAARDWTPPGAIPSEIRLGEFVVDLSRIEGGVSEIRELSPEQLKFRVPAVLPFPDAASLLLETKGVEGRRDAVQAMQSSLLRMLTRIPPGKLRLTVIDPVGLGESFSGLMHLADFDELLITSRIWTEMGHIESRLAELTEHMENVLQKYLRNEFATIEEYNQFAGEVAEPYRVLVVADFPNKFSEQAARRLVSIATSGPRCGVYLMMSVDRSAQMPHNFDLTAIESSANTFIWNRDAFYLRPKSTIETRAKSSTSQPLERRWEDEPSHEPSRPAPTPSLVSRWPLTIDAPPPPDVFTQIVKNVGEASKDMRRVEVSFARIAPKPEEVWTKDSRSGIDIPLGRAGATKLQHLRLGKGTSQHMLVAGKTGSGKSTFFHTLITNVALHYSPQEVELYLVDFKKGVEFKAYAPQSGESDPLSAISRPSEHDKNPSAAINGQTTAKGHVNVDLGHLPHARVIAIESDREFGVSVLQRLDTILNERGELFRRHNVQDIAAYRDRVENQTSKVQSGPTSTSLNSPLSTLQSHLPRILLIIDEFQEFFVEDDRYSQQAALLLDRLVRQGRAFGVHVILGSQTLGGAYSLARSTLGQVAVRVALQCSEADAHLILSEDNTAARLLTRPGEAIYNDANGLVEGNHPFQIAWLSEEERAGYLAVIQHFAHDRDVETPSPIVFEGNVPSDPAHNDELMSLIAGAEWPTSGDRAVLEPRAEPVPRIWLGESVDIGPPTSASFAAQTAQNLLIVGSDASAATGILSTALIALASSVRTGRHGVPSADPHLYLLNGTSDSDYWQRLAEMVPGVRLFTPQTAAQALEELTAERHRRDSELGETHAPKFVFIVGLSKFRDLRKAEDDFSLAAFGASSGDQAPDPARQFADLLSKGPELGLHTLAWADSFTNADRWLGRQSLREFELRVALPMNAADSSNLIDSPAASRLGVHRALLYREDTGTAVKFRPYGTPSPEWLDWVHTQLNTEPPLEEVTSLEGFQVT